ncbi:MAG: hypothetical protein GC185_07055 [Alphaproteobacteria bacterium]|nr:hypothetical protein [Alphaproteobacteria bacterium]
MTTPQEKIKEKAQEKPEDKLARDPFYGDVLRHYGSFAAAEAAGYFNDGFAPGLLESLSDPRWLTTPLFKLRRGLETRTRSQKERRPLVLFSTGGFAPVHEGHIQMMEAARARMEEAGFDVIGGFMAPAHDSYVSGKGSGAENFPIGVRLELLAQALAENAWIEADPWMAQYTPGDLNFTDIYARLQKYLAAQLPEGGDIAIAYVFGADNARFARAFIAQGMAVCVNRPGFAEVLEEVQGDAPLMETGRIFFADANVDVSSKRIRLGQHPPLPVRQDMLLSEGPASEAHTVFMRDDLDWALAPWRGDVPPESFAQAKAAFVSGLKAAMEKAYEGSPLLPEGAKMDVVTVPCEEQEAWLRENFSGRDLINMDCVTSGTGHPANISRLFRLSDGQALTGGIVHRPDAEAWQDDLAHLPKGDYVLVDDDIATGASMKALEERLPEGVRITERVSLLKKWFKQNHPDTPYNPVNILDARDFLIGSRMGGLVVEGFDGSLGRAPYLSPYVSLRSRASVHKGREVAVSAAIYALNLAFFESLPRVIRLAETEPVFRRLMTRAGFSPETDMADFCRWHCEKLAPALEG